MKKAEIVAGRLELNGRIEKAEDALCARAARLNTVCQAFERSRLPPTAGPVEESKREIVERFLSAAVQDAARALAIVLEERRDFEARASTVKT